MILTAFVIPYFLFGLWSAERFRELTGGDISWGSYVITVLFWPGVWFMFAIGADVSKPEAKEEEKEDDDEV